MTLSEKEIVAIIERLDQECWSCRGGSKPPALADPDTGLCACGGTGYLLTDAGVELIAFLHRHSAAIKSGAKE